MVSSSRMWFLSNGQITFLAFFYCLLMPSKYYSDVMYRQFIIIELLYCMDEKQIKVTLAKIFNWQEQSRVTPLLIQFHSKHNESLIARKVTKATLINNYLEIGVHLKIKYTQSENQMLIIIQRCDAEGRPYDLVGEVELNLDEVLARKIKYYSIGDMDKVLQVQISESQQLKHQLSEGYAQKQAARKRNQNFLKERRKFLQNVAKTQKMLKRTFSEKIMSLLNEGNGHQDHQYTEMQSNNPPSKTFEPQKVPADYQSIQSGEVGSNDMNRKLMKSTSEYGMKFKRMPLNSEGDNNRGSEGYSNNRTTQSQKHKLILSNLNVVPNSRGGK